MILTDDPNAKIAKVLLSNVGVALSSAPGSQG